MAEALTAYADCSRTAAAYLALAAYLDGFEPVEPILAVRDNALKVRIEDAMGLLRASIVKGAPPDELRRQGNALQALFTQAEAARDRSEASVGSSFFGPFTILLRAGGEAISIVCAMLGSLRTGERTAALRAGLGGGGAPRKPCPERPPAFSDEQRVHVLALNAVKQVRGSLLAELRGETGLVGKG